MASSNLNLRVIKFEDPVRSKPVRDNFADIQTEFNALKVEADGESTSTTTSEVVTARDSFTNYGNRLSKLDSMHHDGVIITRTALETCDTITNFTAGTDASAPVRNTDNYVRGPASVEIQKSGTSNATVDYEINITDTTLDDCYVVFDVYIPDYATYSVLTQLYVHLTKDAFSNYRIFLFPISDFKQGWNELKCDWNDPTQTQGTVADTDTIIKMRTVFYTSSSSDTTSIILIDDIHKLGSEFRVIEATPQSMYIHYGDETSYAHCDGYGIELRNDTDRLLTAPVGNPRYDLVRISNDGTIDIVQGTEAASPVPPDLTDGYIPLAWVYHVVGENVIKTNHGDQNNGYIIDKRELLTSVHKYTGPIIDPQRELYYDENTSAVALTNAYVNGLNVTFKPLVTDALYLCEWDLDAYLTSSEEIIYRIRRLENVTWSSVTKEIYQKGKAGDRRYYHHSGTILFRNESLTGLDLGYRIQFKYSTLSGGFIKNQRIIIRRVE